MFLLNIKIVSKNKNSLKTFLNLIKNIKSKKKFRVNFILLNYINKRSRCKIFSILTSPNANKNAQEQFLFKTYSKQTNIFTFNIYKFLVILKKIKLFLFSDVKIKLRFFFLNQLKKNFITKTINPENFKTQIINI